jgi:hypothetical protein
MNLLKRSARDQNGPLRGAALAELDRHVETGNEVLKLGMGMGIVFEDRSNREEIDARMIIDAYFHGQYLHSGKWHAATMSATTGRDTRMGWSGRRSRSRLAC